MSIGTLRLKATTLVIWKKGGSIIPKMDQNRERLRERDRMKGKSVKFRGSAVLREEDVFLVERSPLAQRS